jgi:hypothetical protein
MFNTLSSCVVLEEEIAFSPVEHCPPHQRFPTVSGQNLPTTPDSDLHPAGGALPKYALLYVCTRSTESKSRPHIFLLNC